jgi:KDO2-lipid IV(A) lauroyltransferase
VRPLRWRVEGAAVATAARLLCELPEPAALALGAAAIRTAARVWPRLRRVAEANLERVFPEWTSDRREALLAAHLAQLGRSATEWARLPRRSPAALLERVEFEGLAGLESALERGRGAIVATAHFGFWEGILPALRYRLPLREIAAVGRAQRNPHLRLQVDARRRLGGGEPTLPQDAGSILRALRRGAAVGLLADHYLSPRRGGRLVPFLGLRAWTNPGPATLALRAGSPLLLARTQPLPGGRQRLVLGPELVPPQSGDRARDAAELMARLNAAIGDWIRQSPELWLWLHDRFRGSPDVAGALPGIGDEAAARDEGVAGGGRSVRRETRDARAQLRTVIAAFEMMGASRSFDFASTRILPPSFQYETR